VPHNSHASIISRRALNHNGRISPTGPPDDALCGTARFLIERGKSIAAAKLGDMRSSCPSPERQAEAAGRTERRRIR